MSLSCSIQNFPATQPSHWSQRLRGVAQRITTALLLLLSLNVTALTKENAGVMINSLNRIQVSSYLALNAYYQFSISPGDKSYQEEVEEHRRVLSALISALPDLEGADEMIGVFATLQAIWEDYQRLLETNVNDILNQGYSDLRMVSELASANVTQVNGAGIAIEQVQEAAQIRPDPELQATRESRLLLLSLMTRYSARSATTVSQVFQGASGDMTAEERVARFDENLVRLKSGLQNQSAALKKVNSVATKWAFIKKSFSDMSEDNVPFVVNLYSRKIIEDLNELENLLV